MSEMIAYCGLDCAQCPAYLAASSNNDELKKKTAKEWSEQFGAEINPEDINCLGCKSDTLIGYCSQCGIRSCGISNSVENCAVCGDYGCSKMTEFTNGAQQAKENLEKIRAGR